VVPLGPVPHAATTPIVMTDASFKILDAGIEHRASCVCRSGVTPQGVGKVLAGGDLGGFDTPLRAGSGAGMA